MKKWGLLLLAGLCALVAAAPADAWPTKKKYAQYLESLPPEGERPTDEYARKAATEYFRKSLKDSESARYEWGGIELGNWRGGAERFGTPGWIFSVEVNAKNSYGGYTGFSPYKVIFRSGSIVEVYEFNSRYKAWVGLLGMGNEIPPLADYGQVPESPESSPAPAGEDSSMKWKPKGL